MTTQEERHPWDGQVYVERETETKRGTQLLRLFTKVTRDAEQITMVVDTSQCVTVGGYMALFQLTRGDLVAVRQYIDESIALLDEHASVKNMLKGIGE